MGSRDRLLDHAREVISQLRPRFRLLRRGLAGRMVSIMPRTDARVIEVFGLALVLAERAGATEIGITHLREALDHRPVEQRPAPPSGRFVPVPKREMAFSRNAKTAIATAVRSAGTLDGLTIELIRVVL